MNKYEDNNHIRYRVRMHNNPSFIIITMAFALLIIIVLSIHYIYFSPPQYSIRDHNNNSDTIYSDPQHEPQNVISNKRSPDRSMLYSHMRDKVDSLNTLLCNAGHLYLKDGWDARHPKKDIKWFDIMSYLSILNHLLMSDGYTLDYVYYYDINWGSPVVYARPISQRPYLTFIDFISDKYNDNNNITIINGKWHDDNVIKVINTDKWYVDYVYADGSDEGYLELAILNIMYDQFNLHWHANYKKISIMISTKQLPNEIQLRINDNAYMPSMFIDNINKCVYVSIYVISDHHGLYKYNYRIMIDKQSNRFNLNKELIFKYNIGRVY